jgi:hypothetical protein
MLPSLQLYHCISLDVYKNVYLIIFSLIACYIVISHIHDNDENEIVLLAKKSKQDLATCEIPKRPVFYSQSREDVALYERFYKHPVKCNGTIVEMGALIFSVL